jgi:hypothetical protein
LFITWPLIESKHQRSLHGILAACSWSISLADVQRSPNDRHAVFRNERNLRVDSSAVIVAGAVNVI